MRLSFRSKVFLAALAVAATALVLATAIITRELRRAERSAIELRLTEEATLIADFLGRSATLVDTPSLDDEADRLATLVKGRVTLIAADGRVLGESTLDDQKMADLDNHLLRPEVQLARQRGVGVVERFSTTTDEEMLYAAVTAVHPRVAFVRVAEPLTGVTEQVARVGSRALLAFTLAAPVAVMLAWLSSALLSRRVREVAALAARYGAGELPPYPTGLGGDELAVVARALDTSARALARQLDELARDRAQMEAILSGMEEGVLVVDNGGRLQLVNRAAQTMLRVEASTEGRPYVEVIRHPDITQQLASALSGGYGDARELALARDPGKTFVSRAAPVSGGGAVLVLHDITDLRRADQVRRDFVANISHELRTPLTSIRGYVEALLDDPGHQTTTRQFLEVIARQSARMERLVKDLLRLARLDARQEPLEQAAVPLQGLFDGVLAELGPAIADKRQHVSWHVAPDAATVVADPIKLHDVVKNLVENAVNYSPPEATIEVRTARHEGLLLIQILDSGPGIPPGDLTRVFERFYRVDKSRARPGGTGLGLAIVRHLVELHGGSVSVVNRPEGGAAFTVTLPAPTQV